MVVESYYDSPSLLMLFPFHRGCEMVHAKDACPCSEDSAILVPTHTPSFL